MHEHVTASIPSKPKAPEHNYQAGMRIRLLHMDDEAGRIPPGSEGIITSIEDDQLIGHEGGAIIATILQMDWEDTESRLSVILPIDDVEIVE